MVSRCHLYSLFVVMATSNVDVYKHFTDSCYLHNVNPKKETPLNLKGG